MPSSSYVKGRKKEYEIIHAAKSIGCVAFRSAGSHSPIDVVSINTESRCIRLIQCKPNSMSRKAKDRIEEKNKKLNGNFTVQYLVL